MVPLKPRWALTYLRGPMTQSELRRALGEGEAEGGGVRGGRPPARSA